MQNKEFFAALDMVEREYKLDKAMLLESLEAGLAAAFKKETGENRAVAVKLNPENATIKFYAYYVVVEGEPSADYELSLEEAREIKEDAEIGEYIGEDVVVNDLSRIAAQTAKQVIMQRINEAKREQAKSEMNEKEGELMQAIVRRIDGGVVYVEIVGTQMEGVMAQSDQIFGEKLNVNDKIKVYVKRVRDTSKGAIWSKSKTLSAKRVTVPRWRFTAKIPILTPSDRVSEPRVCASTRSWQNSTAKRST